ncbi:aldose 1-epimerase family protein [Nocardioides sp. YIM 152588]|uniref:aldose 1-epimerase family protein n=1 Tax=Nocardioides sp. YIM 152588 TaxID=3158259 RepID=UPI0032E3F908
MTAPTGTQYPIAAAGYRAVVTEAGAALRSLEHDGRALIAGFAEDAMPSGGAGQVLVPWPNRIRDGRYAFDGATHQLPLSEVGRANASHGLVRWVSWTVVAHTADAVTLAYRLPAQSGYPWLLDLSITYALARGGLAVTQSVTNRGDRTAPYAAGHHPYLRVNDTGCDGWTLRLPAATRLERDPERLLPTGRRPVSETDADFREPRPIGATRLDHAFTDLDRDETGVATTSLVGPGGDGVALWVDGHHRWLQVFTAEGTSRERAAVAVEPMTSPPDAFNSGDDLVRVGPGETFTAAWGIRAL